MSNMQDMPEILSLSIMGLIMLLVVTFGLLAHQFLGLPSNHSRKLVHIGVGMAVILTPFKFTNHWLILVSTIFFVIVFSITSKTKFLSYLQQDSYENRGVIFMIIAIYINFLMYQLYDFNRVFYIPMLVLTISDPVAYYSGFFNRKNNKSIQGAIGFFLSAVISCWAFLKLTGYVPEEHILPLSLFCALIGSLTEFRSPKGWDNLTIPISLNLLLVAYIELWNV